jgi:LacI family transcriptional regulator
MAKDDIVAATPAGFTNRAPTISDVARHAGVSEMTVSRVLKNKGHVRQTTRDAVHHSLELLQYAERGGSRRQGKGPTIADVARLAGVAAMTVSRVINNESSVREATRDIVNKAIKELNYAPNAAAKSLAGATQMRIGLIYSNPSAAYLSEFLMGGLDHATRGNVQLLIEKCEAGDDEAEVVRHLIASGIDGLILPPPICDSPAVIAAVEESGVPAVAVATARTESSISTVSIDDFRAAYAMTRHIVALGHQRIGFIVGNTNLSASAKRLEGYRAAIADSGLPADPDLEAPGLFTYRSGLAAADQLLDLGDPPTAIFASNDDMAAATVAAAHRRGMDVPRDLTVCGFDDTSLATTIWPELTTIRQPIRDMARTAIDCLIDELRARRSFQHPEPAKARLEFELVHRQSDAPPRS